MDKMSDLDLALRESHLELDPKTGYIRWASTNPKHPRNWSLARKAWDIGLITLLELYTCVKSLPPIKFVFRFADNIFYRTAISTSGVCSLMSILIRLYLLTCSD